MKLVVAMLALFSLLIINQNCSKVKFAASDSAAGKVTAEGSPDGNTLSDDGDGNGDDEKTPMDEVVTGEPADEDLAKHACDDDNSEGSSDDDQKVNVCHVPPGNPDARHTICISVNGYINGHMKNHHTGNEQTADYLGECNDNASED